MSDPLRRLVGAVVGGAFGYAAFRAIEAQEIRALALVGVCLAVGAGIGATCRRVAWGIAIAVGALLATAVVDWQHSFRADESFLFFATHPAGLSNNSKLTYLAVVLAGLWFGMGRDRRPQQAAA